ncbi:DUF2336 domain-containing protein [Asticcacaulis sp. EMRT-3]|uniref:DUF2336 domain-containing protein n=1 Tax=Asticcacaulis sp. EMRT-3 TaxID=3040349 RepID=UPI0024AFD62E|nr:DUF2336 domain-containing protein [Asticcacaulis sp. EMRT-3]MDI7774935.1 DUF2336 domain-containing protein [Asticcacaulis sp. EMRT-3]
MITSALPRTDGSEPLTAKPLAAEAAVQQPDQAGADEATTHGLPVAVQDLVVRLCQMPLDLAAPLLRAHLPALTPQALLALIMVTGEAHHRLIAARPGLDWRVIKALLRTQRDTVVLALIANSTLDFDAEDQVFIATRAAGNEEVRAAVFSHPGLHHARAQLATDAHLSQDNLRLMARLRGGDAAGFTRDSARRLGCDTYRLWRALQGPSAVPLALTVCALSFDRAAFGRMLAGWQAAHCGAPLVKEAQKPLLLSVFDLSPEEALRRLRAGLPPAPNAY